MSTPITDLLWARDHLPDLLWIVGMVSHHGERVGLALVRETLDLLEGYLPDPVLDEGGHSAGPLLTGALTAFESVPETRRQDAISELREKEIYERAFPWLFARAMSKYPNMPGAWLLEGWWSGPAVPIVAADEPEAFLRRAISSAMYGQSRASTLTKMVVVARYAKGGRLHIPESMRSHLEILSRYPFSITDEERRLIEPFLRSLFGALAGTLMDRAETDQSTRWAKAFWRTNWRLYSCETTADSRGAETASPAVRG